jgi:Rrf2 family iron-sulfur cluster assembly transcriptional regulator
MRLSTKSRIAINALIDVALHQKWGSVPLNTTSGRIHVSLSLLESLFARLRKAGLVESSRGPGGGYTMVKKPELTTLYDVLVAIEGDLSEPQGSPLASWMQEDTWTQLQSVMADQLRCITLGQLVLEHQKTHEHVEPPLRNYRSKSSVGIFKQPSVKLISSTAPNSVFAFAKFLASKG